MSFFDLSGKNALITGGSSGIGLAVAERYLASGVNVAIADLQPNAALDAKGALFFQTDVANPASVEQTFAAAQQSLGKLDIVVNNAGIAPETGSIDETDIDAARATIDVNLNGVMWGLRFAPACMRNGGSIINTASAAATLGFPTYGPYAASKAGIVGLTHTAAIDLGLRGIRVNAVCPGTVATQMQPDDDMEGQFMRQASPLGRLGSTNDLVGIYHFLAADESSWMTGQAVYVDGGITLGYARQLVDQNTIGANEEDS